MIRSLVMMLMMTISMNSFGFFDNSNKSIFDKREELLSAEMAFQPSAEVKYDDIVVNFNIQKDYHIYFDQLIVKINGKEVGFNGGQKTRINDEFFGDVDVFKHFNSFIIDNNEISSEKLDIEVGYQGCASKLNVCYPTEYYNIQLGNPIYDENYIELVEDVSVENSVTSGTVLDLDSSTSISSYLMEVSESSLFFVFILAFVGGILVAFTPCIYPMIPIITGIVVSNKKDSPLKLTSLYVVGIALCYASIFTALELLNINIQSLMMNNITSLITSLILIFLSLVVIGFMGFQIPSGFQTKVNSMNDKLANKGSWAMIPSGYLSALILSPCATAPLAGILLFASALAASYGLVYGVSLVFAFGLGVGFPIILISTYFKKFMPKNGNWMNIIKMLIGLFILSIGFGLLLNSMSNYISVDTIDLVVKIFTISCIAYFIIFTISSLGFFKNTLKSFVNSLIVVLAMSYSVLSLDRVVSVNDYNEGGFNINDWVIVDDKDEMIGLINNGKKSIVFVSADWCVICDKLKKTVLSSSVVIENLEDYNKIYVDITERGSREDILDFYGMKLAPYFTFYSSVGELHNNDKFVGYINEDRFLAILEDIE